MTDLEIGWVAGIIDGEGSIVLERMGKMWRTPRIYVPSTDIEILQHLQHLLGGNIGSRNSSNPKHKPNWQWRINGANKVIEILSAVRPHLRCPKKQRRADHIIANYRQVTRRNGIYSSEEIVAKRKFESDFYDL